MSHSKLQPQSYKHTAQHTVMGKEGCLCVRACAPSDNHHQLPTCSTIDSVRIFPCNGVHFKRSCVPPRCCLAFPPHHFLIIYYICVASDCLLRRDTSCSAYLIGSPAYDCGLSDGRFRGGAGVGELLPWSGSIL